MSIHVNVTLTKNNIPQVVDAVATNADRATHSIADGIHGKAQSKVAVRTGRLRDGIKVNGSGTNAYEVSASSMEGGADREYAAYNEYGTRHMRAQAFMLPAYTEAMASDVPQAVTQYVASIERAAG